MDSTNRHNPAQSPPLIVVVIAAAVVVAVAVAVVFSFFLLSFGTRSTFLHHLLGPRTTPFILGTMVPTPE